MDGQHSGESSSTLDLLRLCRGIVGHNEDEGIRVLIEVEGIEGTVKALKAACLQGTGPPARLHLLEAIARAKRANGSASRQNLRLVSSQPDPDPNYRPPDSEEEYRQSEPLPDDGTGKHPSTPVQEMERRKQNRALHKLHKYLFQNRRINARWDIWLEGHCIDQTKIYSPYVLGQKLGFTIDLDVALRVQMGKFQRILPVGETKAQASKRRDKFNRHWKRRSRRMAHLDVVGGTTANTAPSITREQALINKLPSPPGRITIAELADKLRPHLAWRDAYGNMLAITTIRIMVRRIVHGRHAQIGCEKMTDAKGLPTYVLWRVRAPRKTRVKDVFLK